MLGRIAGCFTRFIASFVKLMFMFQKIPDMSCDHCVIRARYDAHKPGETPFLQCSDIKIVQSTSSNNQVLLRQNQNPPKDKNLEPLKRALRLQRAHPTNVNSKRLLYGFAYNPFESGETNFVSIDTETGKIGRISKFRFGIDSYTAKTKDGYLGFMLDEVVGIDNYRNTTTVVLHTSGGVDDVAKRLYTIGSTNGTMVQEADLFQFKGGAINALSWYVGETMAAIRLQQTDKEGTGQLDLYSITLSQKSNFRLFQTERIRGRYCQI